MYNPRSLTFTGDQSFVYAASEHPTKWKKQEVQPKKKAEIEDFLSEVREKKKKQIIHCWCSLVLVWLVCGERSRTARAL